MHSSLKKYFSFAFFCFLFLSLSQLCAVCRSAFDLGSGKFKMVVAEVNGKNVELKYSKMFSIRLGEDFASSPTGTLSDEIQEKALNALLELKKEAQAHGAVEFRGIATAVFRKATNGEQVLENLRQVSLIPLSIASQEKEGEYGFNTALILTPELEEENIISWDSGNASFQIASKQNGTLHVYEGPIGNSLVTKAFFEEVRGVPYTKDLSLNPISFSECEKLCEVLKQKIVSPIWLEEKLSCDANLVVAIGDNESIFGVASKGLSCHQYSLAQVKELISTLAGSTDCELSLRFQMPPKTILSRLILLQSVMEKFGIENLLYKESTGNTLALLVDKDIWQ